MAKVKRIKAQGTAWEDARGWGMNPLETANIATESLGDLHVVSIKPGCVRGNHCHPNAREWILVFGGPARFAWRHGADGDTQEDIVDGESPAFFEIPAGVGHAVMNASNRDIYLISMSNALTPETENCRLFFRSDCE
jgi:uncharacterized RmlC-like cupin family protein